MLHSYSSQLIQVKKFTRHFCVATILLAVVVLPVSAGDVTAKKADDFVDSMGINIKLDRSVYNNNWSQVKSRFQELGIWHYRDGKKRQQ